MNLDDIKQILDLVREHDLAEFELERDGLKVRIRKAGHQVAFVAPVGPVAAPLVAAAPAVGAGAPALAAGTPDESEPVNLAVIKSPDCRHLLSVG